VSIKLLPSVSFFENKNENPKGNGHRLVGESSLLLDREQQDTLADALVPH
jgi:hypothetical protein